MLHEIQKRVRQLSVAGDFLSRGTPDMARLALLLVDNVAELLISKRLCFLCALDDFAPDEFSEIPRKLRDGATAFREKVNLLVRVRELERDDATVIKVAHRIRNDSYHADSSRDRLMQPLAASYFTVVTRLLPTLGVWRPGITVGPRVRAFLAAHGVDSDQLSEESLGELCKQLVAKHEITVTEFAAAITDYLTERNRSLCEFMDLGPGTVREACDHMIQLTAANIPDLSADEQGAYCLGWSRYVEEELRKNGLRDYGGNCIQKLLTRIEQIPRASSFGKVLEVFDPIDRELSSLERLVDNVLMTEEPHEWVSLRCLRW